ncbi:hypothetical protein L0F63_006010, partial [Massospora cicadina]
MFYDICMLESQFERSKSINFTVKTAMHLLVHYKKDVLIFGKRAFELFYKALPKDKHDINLVEELIFLDTVLTLARDSLRAIFFNQVRQIELIQHAATENAKVMLEKRPDYKSFTEFYSNYMNYYGQLQKIYKAGSEALSIAIDDYAAYMRELER